MKPRRRTLGVLAIIAAVVVVLLFVLPIVPYSLTFHPVAVDVIHFACGPDNTLTCTSSYSSSPPPFTVTGRAAFSYALLGVGTPPFSSTYAFPEGTGSNLFFVRGTNITGAEIVPFTSYELNPVGVVAIQNTTVARGPLGIVNFTATVENMGSMPLDDVSVGFGVPGNGNNATINGATWISYADYTFTGKVCPSTLAPQTDCVASFQAEVETLTPGQTFGYHVQVSGQLGTEGIVYNRWFQGVWPTKEATPELGELLPPRRQREQDRREARGELHPRCLRQGPLPDAGRELQHLKLRLPAGFWQVLPGVGAPSWRDDALARNGFAPRVREHPAAVCSRPLVRPDQP